MRTRGDSFGEIGLREIERVFRNCSAGLIKANPEIREGIIKKEIVNDFERKFYKEFLEMENSRKGVYVRPIMNRIIR